MEPQCNAGQQLRPAQSLRDDNRRHGSSALKQGSPPITRRKPFGMFAGKYFHGSIYSSHEPELKMKREYENQDGTEIDQRRIPPVTRVSMRPVSNRCKKKPVTPSTLLVSTQEKKCHRSKRHAMLID